MATVIKSELLLASKNAKTGDILYSFRLTFPRIILAEQMTHRKFSRNTSSTRAIPTIKMIKAILTDMFVPSYIGAAQKGMTAGAEFTGFKRTLAVALWKAAGFSAVLFAFLLYKLGVAKQIAGRIVEPWSWVVQVASMTDINNFLLLRNHEAAEPHIAELARLMQEQVESAAQMFRQMEIDNITEFASVRNNIGKFQILQPGEWHIPFIKSTEKYSTEIGRMVSAARCARTSYTLLETGKESSMQADLALCERLFGGTPAHLSPTEHQAEAMPVGEYEGNFRGWKQYRKFIPFESGQVTA